MTTFVGWLNAQAKREDDPVGWFARFWRDLPQRPRLSSPASIARHLEDRGLFQEHAPHLQQAYDATLKEYRQVRDQTVQRVSGIDVSQPVLPGMPESPGQVVERATRAGVEAAMAAAQPQTQLDRIEAKLDRLLIGMGLAVAVDGAESLAEIPWGDLAAVADMTAEAE